MMSGMLVNMVLDLLYKQSAIGAQLILWTMVAASSAPLKHLLHCLPHYHSAHWF